MAGKKTTAAKKAAHKKAAVKKAAPKKAAVKKAAPSKAEKFAGAVIFNGGFPINK